MKTPATGAPLPPVPHYPPPNEDIVLFHRADGRVICEQCGKPYLKHPPEDRVLGYNQEPFLHRLCDGTLVKL